jgi:hypothetical protein
MLFIFDLDGTVINSSHRQNTLPDGSLNLADWIENNTPEKIGADTLLPLADSWKTINRDRDTIAIMTARVMGHYDYMFLAENGLYADYIYSRKMGDNSPDDILKKRMVYKMASDMKKSLNWIRSNSWMFDDNNSVRKCLTDFGIRCYNPTSYNENKKVI